MRSSAMRDLMAITARPEVISLAGGLPDTSTFPPQSFAALRGKAIMIHVGGDNYSDQPAPLGGGGARLACGVLQ